MMDTLIKSEILEQENKLFEAMKGGDVGSLNELLHDGLLFMTPGGTVITKAADMEAYSRGELKIDELIPEIENLNIIDNLAVITLTLELKGSYKDESFGARYRYIRFWKKFDDGIKVVGGSGILI